MPTVYRKSDQGRREIETRALGLAPRARSALILVDGRRDDTALLQLLGDEAPGTLAQLQAQGYVEVVAITAPEPRPSPRPLGASAAVSTVGGAPTPSSPEGAVRSFEERRQAAAADLARLLGANARMSMSASVAARKIERSPTPDDLAEALRQAERLIAMGVDSATAARFRSSHRG
jgi:hypothetical protein